MTVIERRDCTHFACHVLCQAESFCLTGFEDACGTIRLLYALPFPHLSHFPGRSGFYLCHERYCLCEKHSD